MIKQIISIIISIIFLGLIYSKIDIAEAITIIKTCDLLLFTLSMILIIPVVLLAGHRLQIIAPIKMSLGHSIKYVLLANLLNLILPAKLGDVAKAYFITKDLNIKGSLAMATVMAEKISDILAMCIICIIGLYLSGHTSGPYFIFAILLTILTIVITAILLSRRISHLCFHITQKIFPKKIEDHITTLFKSWTMIQHHIKQCPKRFSYIGILSLMITFLHLYGTWILFISISKLPLIVHLGLTPLGLLAGLAPVTLSGIGTRDAALVVLFMPFVGQSTAAALGLLTTLRLAAYGLPGIPYLKLYLTQSKAIQKTANAQEL